MGTVSCWRVTGVGGGWAGGGPGGRELAAAARRSSVGRGQGTEEHRGWRPPADLGHGEGFDALHVHAGVVAPVEVEGGGKGEGPQFSEGRESRSLGSVSLDWELTRVASRVRTA